MKKIKTEIRKETLLNRWQQAHVTEAAHQFQALGARICRDACKGTLGGVGSPSSQAHSLGRGVGAKPLPSVLMYLQFMGNAIQEEQEAVTRKIEGLCAGVGRPGHSGHLAQQVRAERGRPEEGRAGEPSSGPWVVSTSVTARSPGCTHSIVRLQGYPGDAGVAGKPRTLY